MGFQFYVDLYFMMNLIILTMDFISPEKNKKQNKEKREKSNS